MVWIADLVLAIVAIVVPWDQTHTAAATVEISSLETPYISSYYTIIVVSIIDS